MPLYTDRGSGTPVTTGTTWAALTNAVDGTPPANPGTLATYTNATSGAVGTIEISGYDFGTVLTTATGLTSITVRTRHLVNTIARFTSVAVTCWDGATQIGASQALTLATTVADNDKTFNPTLAQLKSSTFKVRITITGAANTQSRVWSLDHVDVLATYTVPVHDLGSPADTANTNSADTTTVSFAAATPWVKRTPYQAPRNGTANHTINFPAATAGNLLVALMGGGVTHDILTAGWVLRANPVSNTQLCLWTKQATGGETSFTASHNGADYPVGGIVYEFPPWTFGSVESAVAVIVGDDGPVLSGLSGTPFVATAWDTPFHLGSGSVNLTWAAPIIEDYEATEPQVGTDGYAFGIGYIDNYASASWTPVVSSVTGTTDRKEVLAFSLVKPAPNVPTVVAYTEAGGAVSSVAKPAGGQAGDQYLITVVVTDRDATQPAFAVSGFSLIGAQGDNNPGLGNYYWAAALSRPYDGSEPANFTVNDVGPWCYIYCHLVRGATAFQMGAWATATASPFNVSGLTVTDAGLGLIMLESYDGSTVFATTAPGWTSEDVGPFGAAAAFTKASVPSGATGTIAFTATQTPDGIHRVGGFVTIANGVAASAPTVTPLDTANASTADTSALTQVHKLAPIDTANADSTDTTSLTQLHLLAPLDTNNMLSTDIPVLTQVHVLAPPDCRHNDSTDASSITQIHKVTPLDTANASSTDVPVLTQVHLVAPSDTADASSADVGGLTQVHKLAPLDTANTSSTDLGGTLAQVHKLTPLDTVNQTANQTSTVVDVPPGALFPNPTAHRSSADSPVLTQVHKLTAVDTFNTSSADPTAFVLNFTVSPLDTANRSTTDTSTLVVTAYLVPLDTANASTADRPGLTQLHLVTPLDTVNATSIDLGGINQTGSLAPADCRHGHTTDPSLLSGQVHNLAPTDTRHDHTSAHPGFTQTYRLSPYDSLNVHQTDRSAVQIPTDALGVIYPNSILRLGDRPVVAIYRGADLVWATRGG